MKKIISLISAMLISTSLMNTEAISVNGYAVRHGSTGTKWEDIKNQSDYSYTTVEGTDICCIFKKDTTSGLDYTCYRRAEKYRYSVITVNDLYEPDVLTEMFGQDYSCFFEDEINRHYFRYLEEFDYEKLYELPFVQQVELYKPIWCSSFYRNINPETLTARNDPWFVDNAYNFSNTIIHKFTTTSNTEVTDEMFSNFDAEYVHVYKYKTDEEDVSHWQAYYKINGDYSLFGKFDEYVQNIDGVLSSGGIQGYLELQSSSEIGGELAEVLRPDKTTGNQTFYGDIDADDNVDLSDLTMISQYILKDIELEANQIKCADVNADDEVNLQDLALLKQYVMNDDVKLGVSLKSGSKLDPIDKTDYSKIESNESTIIEGFSGAREATDEQMAASKNQLDKGSVQ